MKKIIIATKNEGKAKEFRKLITGFEVVTLAQEGIDFDVEEDQPTFESNALKKAREICLISNNITIADDSGLEVYYLDNRPGVYSARYAGENATDADRNNKLLLELKDACDEERGARFVCAIALVTPDGQEYVCRGECQGVITRGPRGENGFGYDPLFLDLEYGKTFGELSEDIKNKISHRAVAMEKLIGCLAKL